MWIIIIRIKEPVWPRKTGLTSKLLQLKLLWLVALLLNSMLWFKKTHKCDLYLTYHMQDTLTKDSSRTSPASICSDSVVTEHCSPGLTLTSEENSIAGSIACQMTSLERLTLVHLVIVIQEQFHQWLAGRNGRPGEDEKERGPGSLFRWRLALPCLWG